MIPIILALLLGVLVVFIFVISFYGVCCYIIFPFLELFYGKDL